MAIKEVGPLQTGSSAVATGRVEATCTVAGGLEAPRNLAERVRQVASGAHEVASSPRERLRAAETRRSGRSRTISMGSPDHFHIVPSADFSWHACPAPAQSGY